MVPKQSGDTDDPRRGSAPWRRRSRPRKARKIRGSNGPNPTGFHDERQAAVSGVAISPAPREGHVATSCPRRGDPGAPPRPGDASNSAVRVESGPESQRCHAKVQDALVRGPEPRALPLPWCTSKSTTRRGARGTSNGHCADASAALLQMQNPQCAVASACCPGGRYGATPARVHERRPARRSTGVQSRASPPGSSRHQRLVSPGNTEGSELRPRARSFFDDEVVGASAAARGRPGPATHALHPS